MILSKLTGRMDSYYNFILESEEKEENGDRSGSESPKKAEKKSQDRDTSRSPKKRSRRDRSSRMVY